MQKLKLTLIPICVGTALLFSSWYLSYPLSMDSPYDFVYNHISFLYWLSLPILFASFFIVAMKTEKNALRWLMTVCTFLLMYSTSYFYYMIPGSDAHGVRGLTEYFISTGDLDPAKPNHYYFQWPLFFILNKMAILITGLDPRYFEFALYSTIGVVMTSFIYLYAFKARMNGYLAVIAFYIILSYFLNFQWAPFSLSMAVALPLFYLDSVSTKREVILTMLIIFATTVSGHILVPTLFIVYCLMMLIMTNNGKYLRLALLTLIIYALVQGSIPIYHLKSTELVSLQFLHLIETTQATWATQQPHIDVIAQFLSRGEVVTTTIITGIGFVILLVRGKLRRTDCAMLLTGIIFLPTLILGFGAYWSIYDRAFPLICVPASLGASYVCETKFKKYFKSIFLIVLVLFTFVMIHKTFYDREIFFQTEEEHRCAKFVLDNIGWNSSLYTREGIPYVDRTILSHYRFRTYLDKKIGTYYVAIDDDPAYVNKCDYVVYTIGLSKSFLRTGYSVEETFKIFEDHHFDIIYNSGIHIFHKM